MGGAAALLGGLAAFIAAGHPHGGSTSNLPWPNWVISGGAIVLIAGVLVYLSRRYPAARQASMLAAAAGCLYGLQDALTERSTAELKHGLVAMVLSWPAFSLVFIAVCGLLLGQSAFEAAPLAVSLPLVTVLEPLTGISFGIGVYREQINLAPGLVAVELLGLGAMACGVFLVAASPIISGELTAVHEGSAQEAA